MNIENKSYKDLSKYYNEILNKDILTKKSSNDESTPIECTEDILKKIPKELWNRYKLRILDPCCGSGNFELLIYYKLLESKKSTKEILEEIIYFNDINEDRLKNVKNIYLNEKYKLNILKNDYIEEIEKLKNLEKFDLIIANPPYAKINRDGKRASKNHNLINIFIKNSLLLLKENGYLAFLIPDNWMSLSNKNTLIKILTELQIIHIDIHSGKKYFKKIGSSFTYLIIKNTPYYENIKITGIYKKEYYEDSVKSQIRDYIPLLYNSMVENILKKTLDNDILKKYNIQTSSDLHHYTKKKLLSDVKTEIFKYKIIHTPSKIVYASRPHKYQEKYKVFISLTDKYKIFIDNCGMTQSVGFIIYESEEEAYQNKKILEHPIYVFLNNICRYGNFNNVRILQKFPIISIDINYEKIYEYFNINNEEIKYIESKI
jgi:type I restriction-modification system DNA methylase subunit